MTDRPDDSISESFQRKEAWEPPEVRSLDAPDIEGGTVVFSSEAYHFGGSAQGTLS